MRIIYLYKGKVKNLKGGREGEVNTTNIKAQGNDTGRTNQR